MKTVNPSSVRPTTNLLTRERLKEMERLIEETLASVAKPATPAVYAQLRAIYDRWKNPRGLAIINRNIQKN